MTEPPPPPPAFRQRVGELVALYDRVEDALRDSGPEADRFRNAATLLCEFFTMLNQDDAFWAALPGLGRDQADFNQLLESLDDFEDHQLEVFAGVGIDKFAATRLARELRRCLQQYTPGALPPIASLETYVGNIGQAICQAEQDLDESQQQLDARQKRSRWRLLVTALTVAGGVVAIGVTVATGGAPVLVGSGVAAGVLTISGAAAAQYVGDQQDKR